MSNFAFLQSQFPQLSDAARLAESYVSSDPRTACFYARRALEIALNWVYQHDETLALPYETTLAAMINEPTFHAATPRAIWVKTKLIKDLGNRAVHDHDKVSVSASEGEAAVRELFQVMFWLARTYSTGSKPADALEWDAAKIPPAPAQIARKSLVMLKRLREEMEARDEKMRQTQRELLESQGTGAQLQADLDAARAEIAAAKAQAKAKADVHDYSEAQTRDFLIDLMLREAGWKDLKDKRDKEFEVLGMPPDRSTQGRGFVDYVLWGQNGKPLALVEAKRARKDSFDALEQGKLYADCLEKAFGQRPLIFTSNGYQHWLWDDAGGYPPREVAGFYTRDELERWLERRAHKQALAPLAPLAKIVERPYQVRAIGAYCDVLEMSGRRGLLVMATGTGKTRVSIALCELLSRAGWAKNILFLCDRRALVRQSFNAFKAHWPDSSPVNLLETPDDSGRVFVSTYPTMMNLLEHFEDDAGATTRRFGPGFFDLVIIDEAHRGVYQKYRALFDYFDAMFLGLTATPRSQVERDTFKLFGCRDERPTDSYELAEAVDQDYLVPPRFFVSPLRFPTRGIRYDDLSDEERAQWDEREWNAEGEVPDEVNAAEINAWVFNRDTVEKVLEMLMQKGQRVAGGDRLAKTIIFARNREHARKICKVFNENYPREAGKTARVITGEDPFAQNLITQFSQPDNPLDIAISVDMLDTGIDVPQVGNLVFFKPVRSRIKWSQMLGRGTRLCPDLFGAGEDKREFFVFDFCDNYKFFNENPDVREAAPAKTLSVRLFNHRVELLDVLPKSSASGAGAGLTSSSNQRALGELPRLEGRVSPAVAHVAHQAPPLNDEFANIRRELADGLHAEVESMNVNNVIVRPHRRTVEKWSEREQWNSLSREEKRELEEELAALPTQIPLENESARQFDLLMYRLELATLRMEPRRAKLAKQVREIVDLLLTTQARNVPQVAAQLPLLEEMNGDGWWSDATVLQLETARKKLRELVGFIEKSKRHFVHLDLEDDWESGQEIAYDSSQVAPQTASPNYKRLVENYLKTHRETGVVGRLHRNEELTPADLEELDRQLFEVGGFPDRATFEREIGPQPNLGVWVRELVGLEPAAVRAAFARWLSDGSLSPTQILFVENIVGYLCKNGVLEKVKLGGDPWKSLHAGGIGDLFGKARAHEILATINQVNDNALAM